jgi:phosphate/sulfate permease
MSKDGTHSNPEPAKTRKVEPKVWWATIGSYVAGVIGLALVNAFTADNNVLLSAVLPDVIEPFVLPLVPAIVAFVAGFSARHQWRSTEVANPPANPNY